MVFFIPPYILNQIKYRAEYRCIRCGKGFGNVISTSWGTNYCYDCYSEIPAGKYIQVRIHKKKRINKKWAKRYGYKLI